MTAQTPYALKSYICGEWKAGARDGIVLRDAGTGAAVATIDASGLDMAEALEFGRRAGGALRAMTVHQRAEMLKALGKALTDHKDAFHALSLATGATPRDGMVDIEGGIHTLFSYSGQGRRELPNTRVLVEGNVEPLSKDGSFAAQHILSPL